MTDAQFIALFGMLLSAVVIPILKKVHFEQWVNSLIALVIYALGAVIVTLLQYGAVFDADTPQYLATNFATIFASGTIGYVALWRNGLDEAIASKILP